MSRRHYDLPPFTTLSAFEAAARHLSFKNAAQELAVTPGAVSHQIKALEGELGTRLFQRQHRGVELTSEGTALYETLAASFGQISRQLTRIRQVGDDGTVTVGSTSAVAALWLSPSIIRFWREYPEINVNQVTQDRAFQNPSGFDFLITYGKATTPSLDHTPIYRDDLVPVAAPDVTARLTGQSLSKLAGQRLVHLETDNPSWTKWSDWFRALGHKGDLAPGTRVTSYSVALQIARQGAGIALGWRRLVQPMLDSEKLAVITPHSISAPHQFYLAGLPEHELSRHAATLKDWLLRESNATQFS
ncbi:MAG: LysR substrate-binding domain-containing protein [Pseudomonadota bacterium]